MKRSSSALALFLVVGLLGIAPAVTAEASAAPATYASCKALNKRFKSGVAKSATAASKVAKKGYKKPSATSSATKVFRANAKLDTNHNGAVCEVKAPAKKSSKSTAKSFATTSTYYANCDDVRAHGAAPIYAGDPGYSSKLDRDGDGVGCED